MVVWIHAAPAVDLPEVVNQMHHAEAAIVRRQPVVQTTTDEADGREVREGMNKLELN